MPVGFSLMDLSRYRYGSNLDRLLRRQVAELYTAEYQEFYLRVIWAQGGDQRLSGTADGFPLFRGHGW